MMENSTKQEILKTAKDLFNQRGFNAVSLRDISGVMGISKGNLTYHFKKKEDIIEAILDEMSGQYRPPQVPQSLGEMNALFMHLQTLVKDNAFYFWHHAQLAQVSPKIREQQSKVYQTNTKLFRQAFAVFNKDGVLLDEHFLGQYEQTIDSLLLACIYWIPFGELKQKVGQPATFQRQAWGLLYPLLTEKGKKLLQEIIG